MPILLPTVEHYTKGENVEIGVEVEKCLPVCVEGVQVLMVHPSTKMRDIIDVALNTLKTSEQVVWVGSGPAVVKVVMGVEVTKRRVKNLHQLTRPTCMRVEEYWEPKLEGLDTIKVTREVPALVILLSKVSLDPTLLGYQEPGTLGEDFCRGDRKQRKQHRNWRARDGDTARSTNDVNVEHRKGRRAEGEEGRRQKEWEERRGEERERKDRGRGAERRNFHSHRGRGEKGREKKNYSDENIQINYDIGNDKRQENQTGVGRGVRNRGDSDNRVEFVSEHGLGSR